MPLFAIIIYCTCGGSMKDWEESMKREFAVSPSTGNKALAKIFEVLISTGGHLSNSPKLKLAIGGWGGSRRSRGHH